MTDINIRSISTFLLFVEIAQIFFYSKFIIIFNDI